MQRLTSLTLSLSISAVMASGQADSQQAYQQAKAAYQAGRFTEARDLALKASQTDPSNPEVFLLLGKAYYQLGSLDKAITAWKRTLSLAPEEPYATRMLALLRGEREEVDSRIRLVEAMVREKLFSAACKECTKLLADKAVSDTQRAKILTLQAEALTRTHRPLDAQKILRELLVLYPAQADPVQTALLLGLAKLTAGGESTAEGLSLLRNVVAEHGGTAPAATAQYELIAYSLKQGIDPTQTTRLAKWLSDNPKHPLAPVARRLLLEAYLTLTRQGPKPGPETGFSQWDAKAWALAEEICRETPQADKVVQLTEHLLKHLNEHYCAHGAYAAAVKGAQFDPRVPWPRRSMLLALRALGSYKAAIALRYLEQQSREGKLPATAKLRSLPKVLAAAVAVYQTITKDFPADPAWTAQAKLAVQVRTFASKVLRPAEVKDLTGPEAWAIHIALPVLRANADATAVKTAVEMILGIVDDYTRRDQAAAREVGLTVSRLLLDSLALAHASYPAVMRRHAQLLDSYARYEFQENIEACRSEKTAELSPTQKELLQTLRALIARDAHQADYALKLLHEHVKPWIEYEQWEAVEQAYNALAKSLPEAYRRETALSVVDIWIQQVAREHRRLIEAGLAVPRKLHPTHARALARCYQLQAGLRLQKAALKKIRALSDTVINHYKALGYYDIAEEAITVKGEKPIDEAEQYAAFQLALLREEQARHQLARFLKQYGAAENIVLGPAFTQAIAAYKKFISERPGSPFVTQATERIFAIGSLFEKHGAYGAATTVYGDLAKFAAKVKVLSQSKPGVASTLQQAVFAVANALDAKARNALKKQRADCAGTPGWPPAELSAEFAKTIASYKGFLRDYPNSPLAAGAIGKVMAVGYEYAAIDAWDVADSIFKGLLESKLKIRQSERLWFCRGLCQLGRAMPAHARGVLKALTEGPARRSGQPAASDLLAANEPHARGERRKRRSREAYAARETAPDESERAELNGRLLAMIRQQESRRAAQIAQLRDAVAFRTVGQQPQGAQQSVQGLRAAQARQVDQQQAIVVPVLSEAELIRQEKALTTAYEMFQGIRAKYPHTPTAEQARGEIAVMVGHWRGLGQWQRAAALAERFLADNPTDRELPKLRLEIARDRLAWAATPLKGDLSRQALLAEVSKRFDAARGELARIVKEFPEERTYRQEALWEIAASFLKQARVVSAFSPTLARGQYVRAAKELRMLAVTYPTHPKIKTIPQSLWSISQELERRAYYEEAIAVWNELMIHDPMHKLSQQAALKIAQTYHRELKRPLQAAEAYQELHFARGGQDQGLPNAVFQIGTELKTQKRWVEALHVLESFVSSFPDHGQAGQALTIVGQIHQVNEAWEDAIAAYRRVIAEFKDGKWVQDAKWAIAECTINLSRWPEAMEAYREYVKAYPKDSKAAEATRRIDVLKDLVRYQGLVDEKGQRKAFDAQYQIAAIVASKLSNPVKAIIEYRKVPASWPKSHLADDALYAVGTTYLQLGEMAKAREALLEVPEKYPTSPLADDALFMVGKSYEDEAENLAVVTRKRTIEESKMKAQREAYRNVQSLRGQQQKSRAARLAGLKKAGKVQVAEAEEAAQAAAWGQFDARNVTLFARKAFRDVEALTAAQLADRQDKINAALRKAVEAYTAASKVAGADKAGDALLKMATIYDQRLRDSKAAMETWLEIVRQFSGTAVAEDASWKIAQYYERNGKYAKAIEAYKAFLRNYRRSPKAGAAQFAIAENYERLGQWVNAMDSYTNYINNFPKGPLVTRAREQINWIKTYRL